MTIESDMDTFIDRIDYGVWLLTAKYPSTTFEEWKADKMRVPTNPQTFADKGESL